jgi:hypothetical protein
MTGKLSYSNVRVPVPALILVAFLLPPAAAHEIPRDVAVQLWMKPAGNRLQLLARTPLAAIRDVEFPEREGGYLDIEKLSPLLRDAVKIWIADFIELREDDAPLPRPSIAAVRLSLPSDRSFSSFESAVAHFSAPPLDNSVKVVWNQVMIDTLLEYPIRSERGRFSIRPGLEGLGERVSTTLRFVTPEGPVRAYEFTGDPGLLPLDPRWHQAAFRFVGLGFRHILDGTDHLLFLFCLVIPLRRVRPLVGVVTAFTVAHSITLLASAYGIVPESLWFPPLVETLIAVSILWLALENIVGAHTGRRWMVAFGFGLVHGFGFSFALRESLQFAGSHLVSSLLSFNLGVELGQLLVLLVLIPALDLLFRYVVAERMGTIVLSALVAHTAWHWMTERWETFRKFPLPAIDPALVLAVLVLGCAVALAARLLRRSTDKMAPSCDESSASPPSSRFP